MQLVITAAFLKGAGAQSSCPRRRIPPSTSLQLGSHDTLPGAQTWSRLSWTTLEVSGEFMLHDPSRSVCRQALGEATCASSGDVLLAASKWGLFFKGGSDGAVGRWTTQPFDLELCDAVYKSPVYVINILTWQVGHLVIDVLEPLYYAMALSDGGVDRDGARGWS